MSEEKVVQQRTDGLASTLEAGGVEVPRELVEEAVRNEDSEIKIQRDPEEYQLEITRLEEEILGLKKQLTVGTRFLNWLEAQKNQLGRGYRAAVFQVMRPFRWTNQKIKPHVVKHAYRMAIDRAGYKHAQYEIVVNFIPTHIGDFFGYKHTMQGYRKTIDGWLPFGSAWSSLPNQLVGPSMKGYLHQQYMKERMAAFMNALEKRQSPLE